MAVSKRVRYEVLRRDNHTCRYCGGAAPDVVLTVDHVIPVTLGGSDHPSNLVAACKDCNAGKSSIAPDSALVADVEQDALRWAAAMRRAAEIERAQRRDDEAFFTEFIDAMVAIASANLELCFPDFDLSQRDDYFRTIIQFRDAGLDVEDLSFAIRKAMGNRRLSKEHVWRYFCGVAWRMVEDRQAKAKALLESEGDL